MFVRFPPATLNVLSFALIAGIAPAEVIAGDITSGVMVSSSEPGSCLATALLVDDSLARYKARRRKGA